MKVTKIKELKNNIFKVTLSPNKLGKFFGKKEITIKVKRNPYYDYMFGCGGNVCYDKNGVSLGSSNQITIAIHRYIFKKENKF